MPDNKSLAQIKADIQALDEDRKKTEQDFSKYRAICVAGYGLCFGLGPVVFLLAESVVAEAILLPVVTISFAVGAYGRIKMGFAQIDLNTKREQKYLANLALSKLTHLSAFRDTLPEIPDVAEKIRQTELAKQKASEAPSFFTRVSQRFHGFFHHTQTTGDSPKNERAVSFSH